MLAAVLELGEQNACGHSGRAVTTSPNRGTQDRAGKNKNELLPVEVLEGEGVWISPNIEQLKKSTRRITAKVWFGKQFLGDGKSYRRRAQEFSGFGRRKLRDRVVRTLRELSTSTFAGIEQDLKKLVDAGQISNVQKHWIINGFTCTTTINNLEQLKKLKGVKKIFVGRMQPRRPATQRPVAEIPAAERDAFDPERYKHPWYTRSLLADRVWKEFNVTGQGTLNVIHDFNFVVTPQLKNSLYRNPRDPVNGKDDDGNGLIDDTYGYNFQAKTGNLQTTAGNTIPALHGSTCANIICGNGTAERPFEMGLAPTGQWAGVIAGSDLESAVEWAILHQADTYSMSFSIPGLGEMRSHWRKVMEHGSFCGIYFVSGAGNFAQTARVPVQMRTPEDIPDVVFAAAGVQRDLSRTPFSSQGPVDWDTEHYHDGKVQKPEVCAFNMAIPVALPDGRVLEAAANGNSFAGPMFCGSIALMVSADPDLLPWDLKEIITSTALDVGPPGVDYQTGHGLINCYRSVKEVLRRKAIREGRDPAPWTGRSKGDQLDVRQLRQRLGAKKVVILRVNRQGSAFRAGLRTGDQITAVEGMPVSDAQALQTLIKKLSGEKIEISWLRNGKKFTAKIRRKQPGLVLVNQFAEPVFK